MHNKMSHKIFSLVILFAIGISSFAQDILFNKNSVSEIKIYFDNPNWDSFLDSVKAVKGKERLPASIVINGNKLDSIGIRFKGNSSYNKFYKKNPLNIKLDAFVKQKYNGMDKLFLSNIFKDPSAIREVLAYEIAREFMIAPEAGFAEVYINDSLLGLYTCVEPIDKEFIKKHFGIKKNPFFKCDRNFNIQPHGCRPGIDPTLLLGFDTDSICYMNSYEIKSKHGWKQLLKLLNYLWYNNDSTSEFYKKIEEVLDIESALKMLAFDNLLVNLDSYLGSGHNYYIFQDTLGKFHTLLWDLNESFGTYNYGYQFNKLAETDPLIFSNNKYKPLISVLLNNPKYKTRYFEIYKEMYDFLFEDNFLINRANELNQLIAPYINKDPYFYYSEYDFKNSLRMDYKFHIPGILKLMEDRRIYLNEYFKNNNSN